jgi:two-component system, LytTR family, response regulator
MAGLKALIVDDELQSRNFLHKMIGNYFPEIKVSHASCVKEALEILSKENHDIVFLDIQMKNETGFDLLKSLEVMDFALIFTTAYDQYAVKAFRFNAIDYLLKPINTEELTEAIIKVKERAPQSNKFLKEQADRLYLDLKTQHKFYDKIAIATNEGFIVIPINDIIYCRAKSNYTQFYLKEKKRIISSYTLKEYDEMLCQQNFFRAHRSFLINMLHVKMYKKGDGGEIIMSNGDEIELSRTHKDEFLYLLNIK